MNSEVTERFGTPDVWIHTSISKRDLKVRVMGPEERDSRGTLPSLFVWVTS